MIIPVSYTHLDVYKRQERILPAIMNDNYFTLMPGETKDICITFDEALLQGGSYKLLVTPYNLSLIHIYFHVCWLALIIIIMVQVLWILVYRKLLSCVRCV